MELFPDECIFCDGKIKKIKQNYDNCLKFAVFKTSFGGIQIPSYKKIEQEALELELFCLHRKVQEEDLFAKKAKFLQSCLIAFTFRYAKLLKKRSRENASVILQPSSSPKLSLKWLI